MTQFCFCRLDSCDLLNLMFYNKKIHVTEPDMLRSQKNFFNENLKEIANYIQKEFGPTKITLKGLIFDSFLFWILVLVVFLDGRSLRSIIESGSLMTEADWLIEFLKIQFLHADSETQSCVIAVSVMIVHICVLLASVDWVHYLRYAYLQSFVY